MADRLRLGRLEQPRVIAVEHDDDRGADDIGGQLGAAHAGGQLAGHQAGQPAPALLIAAAGLDDRGGHRSGQKRRRRARIAELLGQHRELDSPQVLSAVLLSDGDPRPAELDDLAPQLGLVGVALSRFADPRHRRAVGEQLVGDALDLLLVFGQIEIHLANPFQRALGSPSTRSATMFLSTSVVPPSIVLPRARSNS